MSQEREKELLRLAEAVSDGTSVDWERERGTNPDIREPLEHLAVLDRVRRVHEESSRVIVTTDAKGIRERNAARVASARGSRRRLLWLLVALVLAAAVLALVLYSNATKAAM